MKTTLGGDRLGAGGKMQVELNNYERSTHNPSNVWRSTMSAGTLVPFMSILALPGDTFDIDLNCDVMTLPTIGPFFGSYKVQLDVFQVPIRLYHSALHMNMLNIGRNMGSVMLPQIHVRGKGRMDMTKQLDNQQVGSSCVFHYLGIHGIGHGTVSSQKEVTRLFNAVPFLGMWDIYKNYYANKQEDIGAVVHTAPLTPDLGITRCINKRTGTSFHIGKTGGVSSNERIYYNDAYEIAFSTQITSNSDFYPCTIYGENQYGTRIDIKFEPNCGYKHVDENSEYITYGHFQNQGTVDEIINVQGVYFDLAARHVDGRPGIQTFKLGYIDDMRTLLLTTPPAQQYTLDINTPHVPYTLPLTKEVDPDNAGEYLYSTTCNQEGLPIKTYQSDIFNNWLSTEWIDGPGGVSQLSSVLVDDQTMTFTIDEFKMAVKVRDYLNKIAVSGGDYDAWLTTTYDHTRSRGVESPLYLGGLIKELVFQAVVSNSATADQPLGSLAGKGILAGKHKGGHIIAKVDEPSYLLGFVSLTPRIDYSQGNSFDVNLQNMDELHKPAFDQIAFQDLITDRMAWWDTGVNPDGSLQFKSAGKQPAWLEYMTSVNECHGNFAEEMSQMYMTMNRRYEPNKTGAFAYEIKDLTTYIDPAKYNYLFADTRLDSQNFMVQISKDITARRKMSSKLMPN